MRSLLIAIIVILLIFKTAHAMGGMQENQCLARFIQSFLVDDRKTAVFLHHNDSKAVEELLHTNFPKIILNLPTDAFSETFFKSPWNYVMIPKEIEELENTLKKLEKLKWNTKGKFLFVVENITSEVVSDMLSK